MTMLLHKPLLKSIVLVLKATVVSWNPGITLQCAKREILTTIYAIDVEHLNEERDQALQRVVVIVSMSI